MSRIGRFRFVVFDCDGTIVDSQHSIVSAMAKAFIDHGMTPPPAHEVLNFVGLELLEVVRGLAPDQDPRRQASLAEAYKGEFFRQRESGTLHEPLYPGAREAIVGLSEAGILLGVATGKSQRGLRAVLDRHGLRDRFTVLQTADDAPGKPHPGMLLNAMTATGVAPEETVMVGDTSFDMAMARAAKTTAVGVAWGYHAPEELGEAGATHVVGDYAELLPTLARL